LPCIIESETSRSDVESIKLLHLVLD
jgi:hypothetical protein